MSNADFQPHCPLPLEGGESIQLAHGGGGRRMQQLLDSLIRPAFANEQLDRAHDGAVLETGGERLAFTTDSFVVRPLWFPGGDIGSLAVYGTVNDLAMCGARPRWMSAGLILEEGFAMHDLVRVVGSMREAAARCDVQIVTGDTKVVDRGKGDGVYINTAGVGTIESPRSIGPRAIRPGDVILLSGDIGRHGMAVMAHREGLAFESTIESDCAPLIEPVMALLDAGVDVHCLRDLTRGGLAAGLVELATTSRHHLHILLPDVPVTDGVRGACEILGLDPLYVANEGRFIALVPAEQADQALASLPAGAGRIGEVTDVADGQVTLTSEIGATRILDLLSGEQLPRIC